MANVIEILLQTKDQMSSGLAGAATNLTSFASRMAVAGTAAVAAGAAITLVVSKVAEEVEQLDNLSASTGVSTQNLQVLQFAFRQGGVDAAALTQGLNFLNRAIASNDPSLAKLGVTSGNTFDALRQAAAGLSVITDSAERAKLTFDVFGRGGAQLIPILNQVAGNLDGVTEAAIRTGNAMSEDQLQRLREVDTAMDQLSASVKGLGNQFAIGLAPALTAATNAFTGLLEKMAEFQRRAEEERQRGGNPMFARAMGLPRGGGGGEFTLPPGWGGGPGPGGRGTVEFGPGNQAGMQEFAREYGRVLEEASKKALKRAAEGWQTLRLSEGGTLNVRSEVGFGMADADPMAPSGMVPEAFKIGPMVDEAKTHLTTFQEHMQAVAADIIQTFEIIGQHLHNSIVGVFVNLTNSAQTFRSAIVSVFHAIRDGVLQAIGEIVAAQITKAFLKILGIALSFITGNPFAAIAGGATPESGGFGMGDFTAGVPGSSGPGNTFVIQTISSKDVISSIVAPTGAFRSANSRLAEVAAVS